MSDTGNAYDGRRDELAAAGDVGEGGHSAVEVEAATARVPAPSGCESARSALPDPVDHTRSAANDDHSDGICCEWAGLPECDGSCTRSAAHGFGSRDRDLLVEFEDANQAVNRG